MLIVKYDVTNGHKNFNFISARLHLLPGRLFLLSLLILFGCLIFFLSLALETERAGTE